MIYLGFTMLAQYPVEPHWSACHRIIGYTWIFVVECW